VDDENLGSLHAEQSKLQGGFLGFSIFFGAREPGEWKA
jgi:hypothetical protein